MQLAIAERNENMNKLIEKTENEQNVFNKVPIKMDKNNVLNQISKIHYKNKLLQFKKA